MFRNNTSLVHIDLSFCGFREEECETIARGLLLNHIVLGVHMAGNQYVADPLGFVNKIKNTETAIIRDALWRRLPFYGEKVNKHTIASGASGNCWICEGWREVKFVWKNTKDELLDPGIAIVFACLS